MSRLYGRAFDVFQMSKYLLDSKIPLYKDDNKKISLNELIDSSAVLDIYLPKEAIDYIVNHPIHISKSPFLPRNMSSFPTEKEPNASIYFKNTSFREEHKRELNFFLGCVLSNIYSDELPKKDDLPCEYGDILPLLLEYLYLKEINEEDRFVLKHLNTLKSSANSYQKVYETHQINLVTSKKHELEFLTSEKLREIEEDKNNKEMKFLAETFLMLVPFSSLDGLLQIIDKIKTKEEMKELIKILFENKNNNRQEILKDYNIESYGYKRLRKEINEWGIKK